MNLAKAVFSSGGGSITHKYRTGNDAKYADTHDEFTDDTSSMEDGLEMTGNRISAFPGGPFSALTPSMVPQDVSSLTMEDQSDYRYDEFGYRVDIEDGPEEISSKILSMPFVEDPQHRLKWIAHLEFTHNQVVEDLTWDKVDPMLPKSDKLSNMVNGGIAHSLRPFIWPRLCGAVAKRQQANFSYQETVKLAKKNERMDISKQIEKDLLRTMPCNVCFMTAKSTGIPRLRRILKAIAYLYPEIGYCQGMGIIAATLLLILEEEDAFWMMATIMEDMLPASYFSSNLLGLQADQRVLRQLVTSLLPSIDPVLRAHDIELSLISLHWFLTLFSSVLHMRILLRVWDVFMDKGSHLLFTVALAMLRMKETEIRNAEGSAEIFNLLSDLPATMQDADILLDQANDMAKIIQDSQLNISHMRKKQLAILMADQGMLVNPDSEETNLPKQRIQRRRLKRSQSLVGQIFRSTSLASGLSMAGALSAADEMRMKNVRSTELMIDLKDAILRICRHFLAVDPTKRDVINLQADYSADSHVRDHEVFLSGRRKGRKRARALLDFQRQDEDELGFRKNDLITILSQRDEHCWVGELNGLRGWFPAKFVEILDERGKDYSALGDDAVTEAVTDLVRGNLCHIFKQTLEHGIKRSGVLGGVCHPWIFIEEISNREVQSDFDSVYSRLVLCKTFRLDEDGKVLTPEELLYRAVTRVNASHNTARALMDVKLRSLVCLGLNEQCLHLWLEILCANAEIASKWYHPWSFIRSPGWVQIKCELRILSQFSFNLNPDWELGQGPNIVSKANTELAQKLGSGPGGHAGVNEPLKDGVRDMLVKHHLFSWDI